MPEIATEHSDRIHHSEMEVVCEDEDYLTLKTSEEIWLM